MIKWRMKANMEYLVQTNIPSLIFYGMKHLHLTMKNTALITDPASSY